MLVDNKLHAVVLHAQEVWKSGEAVRLSPIDQRQADMVVRLWNDAGNGNVDMERSEIASNILKEQFNINPSDVVWAGSLSELDETATRYVNDSGEYTRGIGRALAGYVAQVKGA